MADAQAFSVAAADASILPDAPAYSSSLASAAADAAGIERVPTKHLARQVTPFSTVAIGFKAGLAGFGFDVATPVGQRFNIRAGASFFSYNGNFNEDGTLINGDLKLRSGTASLDWYPFGNRFRISPGINFYNHNAASATASVPAGQTFDLDDTTFTSSPTDPIHGSAAMSFGNNIVPSFTFGFGNMIPRHGEGHFSMPAEFGFQYIGTPRIVLALSGTACTNGVCQPTSSNQQFQNSLQQENTDLNNNISGLRFYPIASIGVAYRF